jgi:Mn-dependent DtxR family transcriptional regulator
MMPTAEEIKVLKLLAKEWEYSGPPGILDISDIVAALDMAPGEILQALKALYRSGLVDMNKLKTSAFLTPEGYEAAETS